MIPGPQNAQMTDNIETVEATMASSILLSLLLTLAPAQDTGTLRVRVALTDAAGVTTPLPRLLLLISNNPSIDEPRRVRTAADGTIEVRLAPGSYTVELDEPISFRGKAFTWTQIVDVRGGRETVVDLTADNAETAAGARRSVDSATLLTAWRDSVVEIWTPTRHASGFIIDAARGLIATSHRAMGGAATVEVQFTKGTERYKVPGRVLVSERDPGAAIVWVEPKALPTTRAVDPACGMSPRSAPNYQDVLTTITASALTAKEATDGAVRNVTEKAIFSDLRIGSDSEGGPVFAEDGALLGISAIDDKDDRKRWDEAWVVPAERVCPVIAAAVTKTAGATPPAATRLPMEPAGPAVQPIAIVRMNKNAPSAPKPAALAPPTVPAANFDITLWSARMVRGIEPGASSVRTDFGSWSEYVRDLDDHVFLVRVSPQFEESLWKTLARGVAATQGMMLPPLKNFTSNFLQLRAYCGDAEVLPIHPFVIEHEVEGRSAIREGLYAFELAAFGPACPAIRFSMFSERDPQKPDTKVIDPKLFEQLAKP